MSEENNSDVKLKEDLLSVYKSKTSDLQKAFLLLMGFALFFFFMIFIPYFSLRYDAQNLSIIDGIRTNLSPIITEFEEIINEWRSTINMIEKGVNSTKTHYNALYLYKRQLETIRSMASHSNPLMVDVFNQKINAIELFPMCIAYPLNSTEWVKCNGDAKSNDIKAEIKAAFDTIIHPLLSLRERSDNIIIKINNISSEIKNKFVKLDPALPEYKLLNATEYTLTNTQKILQNLNEGVDNVANTIQQGLTQNSETVAPVAVISPQFMITLGRIDNDFDEKSQDIKNELEQRNNDTQKLWDDIENSIQDLTVGLQQVETPLLGRLPIRFEESIAAFPLALSIGFLVCSSLLRQTIFLRSSLHQAYTNKKQNNADTNILSVAPLWIDPIKKTWIQIIQLAIFLTPFFIFIVSFFMIEYIWIFMNENIFSSAPNINKLIYLGLYIISIALFVINIWLIIREISNYFTCKKCERKFRNQSDLQKHLITHSL